MSGAGYGVCGVTKVMKNVLETHEAAIEKKRTIAPATFDPDEKVLLSLFFSYASFAFHRSVTIYAFIVVGS